MLDESARWQTVRGDPTPELGEEIAEENARNQETHLLKSNLRLLREAVFARWASGLDLGGIDLKPFIVIPASISSWFAWRASGI